MPGAVCTSQKQSEKQCGEKEEEEEEEEIVVVMKEEAEEEVEEEESVCIRDKCARVRDK